MFKGLFTPDNVVCEWVLGEFEFPQEIREMIHHELRVMVLDECFTKMREWSHPQQLIWDQILTTRNAKTIIGVDRRIGTTTLCEGLLRIGLIFGMCMRYYATCKRQANVMMTHLKEHIDVQTIVKSDDDEIRLKNGANILCTPLQKGRCKRYYVYVCDVGFNPPASAIPFENVVWFFDK